MKSEESTDNSLLMIAAFVQLATCDNTPSKSSVNVCICC